MQRVPVIPDLKLARTLDKLFRQGLPIYEGLEAFSLNAMMRSLAQAQSGIPLHEAVLAEVRGIIAIEGPGLEEDITQQIRALDAFPVENATDSFIAVYSGYRLVCDWLDPRNNIIPSMAGMRGMAKYLRMLAQLGALEDRGVTINFQGSSPGRSR